MKELIIFIKTISYNMAETVSASALTPIGGGG